MPACSRERRPLLLEIQSLVSPTDLAMPRRVGTGVDPKRLAMIVAVLARHAGLPLGGADVFVNVAGGVRIDEPGADLGIALAIASAAQGTPVRESLGAFGEIGLTGRLRTAAQADRRVEECRKLGLRVGSRSHRNQGRDDRGRDPEGCAFRRARRKPALSRDFSLKSPANVAVLSHFCYRVVPAGGAPKRPPARFATKDKRD